VRKAKKRFITERRKSYGMADRMVGPEHKAHHQHHGISGAAVGIGLIIGGLLMKLTNNDFATTGMVLGVLALVGGLARYYAYR